MFHLTKRLIIFPIAIVNSETHSDSQALRHRARQPPCTPVRRGSASAKRPICTRAPPRVQGVRPAARKPTLLITVGACGAGKTKLLEEKTLKESGFSGNVLRELMKNQFFIDDYVENDPTYKNLVRDILTRTKQERGENDLEFLNSPDQSLLNEFGDAYWGSRNGGSEKNIPVSMGKEKDDYEGIVSSMTRIERRYSSVIPSGKPGKGMVNFLGLEVWKRGKDGEMNRKMAEALRKKESLTLETTGRGSFWQAELDWVKKYYRVEIQWMSVLFHMLLERNSARAATAAKAFLSSPHVAAPRLPDVSPKELQRCVDNNRNALEVVWKCMAGKCQEVMQGYPHACIKAVDKVVVYDNSGARDAPISIKLVLKKDQLESADGSSTVNVSRADQMGNADVDEPSIESSLEILYPKQ